jgi:hypothetical protein
VALQKELLELAELLEMAVEGLELGHLVAPQTTPAARGQKFLSLKSFSKF